MTQYISIDALPVHTKEALLKKRVLDEFTESYQRETRGEVPRIATATLRPWLKVASKNAPGPREDGDQYQKMLQLGRRLMDSDVEQAGYESADAARFSNEIFDGLRGEK